MGPGGSPGRHNGDSPLNLSCLAPDQGDAQFVAGLPRHPVFVYAARLRCPLRSCLPCRPAGSFSASSLFSFSSLSRPTILLSPSVSASATPLPTSTCSPSTPPARFPL